MTPRRIAQTLGGTLLLAGAAGFLGPRAVSGAGKLEIRTLSGDPALVTGGDTLVEVTLPTDVTLQNVKIMAGSRDVTQSFKGDPASHKMLGLITGLANGKTTINVATRPGGKADASLEVTNYPITGPVFSGPQIQPFICQTSAFTLPDGTKLGAPLDANCSARTVVQYVYRSTNPGTAPRAPEADDASAAGAAAPAPGAASGSGAAAAAGRGAAAQGGAGRGNQPPPFKPLTDLKTLPPDVAKTTTTDGVTVNFIVRVETGTMNRGIYQNAILHDPTIDPAPTPVAPPKGWNHRLIGVHGSGCPGGWYIQGAAMGVSPLDVTRLGQGYALFVNTLNHPTNSCNAVVAGESAMMGKEHFVEEFGVPLFTMTTGGSGGAYTSLQIADAYPGLFDGASIRATFPDALAIALSGLDAHLFTHYMTKNPSAFTDAQQVAITGFSSVRAMIDAANQSQRTDPVPNRADIEGYQSARFNAAVPPELRYDPVKNPKGARPTVFDVARNVYGVNPSTGAALRPFDNVGVQYGLSALNSGAITVQQFLDLNEKIGGYDQDANFVAARTAGDPGAIKRAYQAGLMLSGSGGLSNIPIFDNATSNEASGYHYGWFHYAVRDRIRQANGGNSDNMVMWRSISEPAATNLFDSWMVKFAASPAAGSQRRAAAIATKPATGVEGCYDKSTPPNFIAEALVFSSQPNSKCTQLYPVYSNVRREAGGPLAANIMKCQLKPVDAKDYRVAMSAADVDRLKAIFPTGVCDWSKPGVNQVPVVPWASFGPSPKNLIAPTN